MSKESLDRAIEEISAYETWEREQRRLREVNQERDEHLKLIINSLEIRRNWQDSEFDAKLDSAIEWVKNAYVVPG